MNYKILLHEYHKIRYSVYLRRKKKKKKKSALAAIQSQTRIAPLGMEVKKAGLGVDNVIKGLHRWKAALVLQTC